MGRRAKYTNPDDMQALIYLYLEDCKKNREALKTGIEIIRDTITNDLHPSVLGLCLALDLSRKVLIEYEHKDEFRDTVERAKLEIEAYNVQRLYDGQVAGVKFVLTNGFNWKERQEIEHSGDIGNNGGVCRASEILQGFIQSRQNDTDEGTVQK